MWTSWIGWACTASEPAAPEPPHPPPVERAAAPPERPPPQPGEREPVGVVEGPRRSVLLVSWDTVRADHLALWGGRVETPALAGLAARGVRFEAAISHYPETAVSHWTLLTGVEPAAHGDVPGTGGSRYRGPTLAEIAAAEGYATAAFVGGVTMAAAATGLDRGFALYDDHFAWGREALTRPGTEVAHRAAAWIREQDAPWFALVHFFDAHAPYTPPPPYDRRYDPDYRGPMDGSEAALSPHRDEGAPIEPADLAHAVALYDGEIAFLDQLLPQLLSAAGEDAVFALTADHGESFEHGYLFNHREALWDSTLRVPLVIAGPGLPAGEIVSEQVALTDVLPTVLELAGLPGEAKVTGRSLTGLVGGGRGRELVRARTDPCLDDPLVAARRPGDKTIWHADGRVEAYDLAEDPGETEDLGRARDGVSLEAVRAFEASLAPLMRPARPRLGLPGETVEQLQALGYVGEASPCGQQAP